MLAADSITSIIRRIQSSPDAQPKGEFETTQQFNARKSKSDNHVYVFVLPRVGSDFEYDADTQGMSANVFTNPCTLDPTLRTADVKRELAARDQYIGQNALGVKKVISSASYEVFGVAIAAGSPVQLTDNEGENGFGWRSFRWEMALNRAKYLKPYLRQVIVGTIPEPTVFAYSDEHSPTISEPWFREYKREYLLFRLQELRVVDERSGAVVASLTSNAVQQLLLLPQHSRKAR